LALHSHYLGASKSDYIQAEAENKLKNTFYNGERQNWNFEKFVQTHKDQHTAIEGLFQYGYPSLDKCTKVRHLIAGIQTTELESVTNQVWSSVTLRGDFDACVDLYKTFINMKASTVSKTLNDSNVGTDRGGGGRGGRGGNERRYQPYGRGRGRGRGGGRDHGRGRGGGRGRGAGGRGAAADANGEVTDRYYTPQEFEALGPDGRNQVFRLREGRDKQRNVSSISEGDITRIIAAVNARNSQIPATDVPDIANRHNPALQRPK
jgi:hypothetical protein